MSYLDEIYADMGVRSQAIDKINRKLESIQSQIQHKFNEESIMQALIPVDSLVSVIPGRKGSRGLTTSDEPQHVVKIHGNSYTLSNSNQTWTIQDLHIISTPTQVKRPNELDLFETCTLDSNAALTKVPNGYVMTSTTGHQLLIPTNSI